MRSRQKYTTEHLAHTVLSLLVLCALCGVCRYVTYDDKLAPENPFFFCERCYQPIHYNAVGHLHYNDFRVYPYEHE